MKRIQTKLDGSSGLTELARIKIGVAFLYRNEVYIRVAIKDCYIKRSYQSRIFVLHVDSGTVQTMYSANKVQILEGELNARLP